MFQVHVVVIFFELALIHLSVTWYSRQTFFKHKGHIQGHKVIKLVVIWEGVISRVYMPNRKSSLTVEKL